MIYVNLWRETISVLEDNGLTWDDVDMVWIEWKPCWDKPIERCGLTKENFRKLAKRMEYNNDFGRTYVNKGLHIRGHDKVGTPFIMFRNKYDGSEWWELHFLYAILPIKEVKNLGDSPFEEDE